MNVPATFEVRSLLALPVPELIGGGGVATSQKWFDPWLCPRSLSPRNKKNLCLPYRLFFSVYSFSRDASRVLNVKSAVLYRMRSLIGSQ